MFCKMASSWPIWSHCAELALLVARHFLLFIVHIKSIICVEEFHSSLIRVYLYTAPQPDSTPGTSTNCSKLYIYTQIYWNKETSTPRSRQQSRKSVLPLRGQAQLLQNLFVVLSIFIFLAQIHIKSTQVALSEHSESAQTAQESTNRVRERGCS